MGITFHLNSRYIVLPKMPRDSLRTKILKGNGKLLKLHLANPKILSIIITYFEETKLN